MKRISFLFLVGALLAFGCVEKKKEAQASIDQAQTRAVIEHHWKSFQDRDLDALMSDYTDESIFITPDKTFRGLAEIRESYAQAFVVFPKDSTSMQVNKTIVEDDLGYILWEATVPKFKLPYASDTFVIRNGKIVRQTYAGSAEQL
jgi:hypothetical protein